jgi:hypothetical protein
MASQHHPTEVFRFLHSRNPRLVTSTSDSTEFFSYTLPQDADNLYTELLEIKNIGEENWKDQIIIAVTQFKEADEGFKNLFDVTRIFSDFNNITEYLQHNDLPGGVTIQDWLINEYNLNPTTFFTDPVNGFIDQFWNNLFAQVIVSDNNGVFHN